MPAATPVRIVVWDNIGNTLLGVRPWSAWDGRQRTRLIEEDGQAEAHAPAFDQLFAEAGFQTDLTWLYDPNKLGAGFGSLLDDYAGRTRPFTDTAKFAEIARDADIIVLHKETLPPEAIANTPKLQAMLHLGQDYRGVPSDALRARRIPIAATPLVNYIAVAEHVWAFILNHVKKLPGQRRHMDSRAYVDSWGLFPGTENVRDLTLGLLGFGEIARPIARVAKAFDMRTLYWDVRRFPELEAQYGVEYAGWDELFAHADVLSVQLALNPQTYGIIGAKELAKMKPTALFINTARGKLIDQSALVDAVRSRRVGALALDVYAEEPLPPDDPLLTLHADPSYDITLTPHSAWQSPWTWIRDSQALWHDAIRALKGEEMRYQVEP